MKQSIVILFLLQSIFTFGQEVATNISKKEIKSTLFLTVPGKMGDQGTNGASVVFNPSNNLYYAAMAGNSTYTMGVFDKNGRCLSDEKITTLVDVRGLWYNKSTKEMCCNGYDNAGWYAYHLGTNKMPDRINMLNDQGNPTDPNSVGTSDGNGNVFFLSFSNPDSIGVVATDMKGNVKKKYPLYPNSTSPDQYFEELYNSSTVVYTGIPNKEFGLLNYSLLQIELYSKSTGKCTEILSLPANTEVRTNFNFAYTNGLMFIFNADKRTWTGYR